MDQGSSAAGISAIKRILGRNSEGAGEMARSKDKGKEGTAAMSKKASQLLDRLTEWPESWAIDDEKDIRTGEEITAVLREFAQSLVDAGLAPSTIDRHLSNLRLLGGVSPGEARQISKLDETRKNKMENKGDDYWS
jgi:hypothetical protein